MSTDKKQQASIGLDNGALDNIHGTPDSASNSPCIEGQGMLYQLIPLSTTPTPPSCNKNPLGTWLQVSWKIYFLFIILSY